MRIVCVGDSVTFGEHVPTSERWTTVMAEQHPWWNVLTRAVCADTTRLGLERFPQDVENARPDVVVIQFGHNDANVWSRLPRVSERAYTANLAEMYERARVVGASQVVFCTPHRTHRDHGFEERLARYAEQVRRIAVELDASLVDAHARDDIWPHDGVLDDGLHLSPWGHEQMAGLVAEQIK